jgi:3-oxoacyl-[acyl-carrier-protein] synthase II
VETRKVFITGTGTVTPFGVGLIPLMQGLEEGRSAIVSLKEQWEAQLKDLQCWVGGPAPVMDIKIIPRTFRRSMGPTAQMAWFAAQEAVSQAGLDEALRGSGRCGVAFGSTTGSVQSYASFFERYFKDGSMHDIQSGAFFQVMSHTSAANLAHAFGVRGRVFSTDSACSSGSQAIGLAYEAILSGRQDQMLAGGSDELHPLVSGSFDLVHASSVRFNDQPQLTPRPFDQRRDGTVCGAGAGCVVLESEESMKRRGARPLAQILGFETLADGANLAQPNRESIVRCLQSALQDAKVRPDEVGYVNAHATGTEQGDVAEAGGIAEVLGGQVPVSGYKGHIGHTTGASGAVELAAALHAMRRGILIPTRNLETPAQECAGVMHVRPGMKPRSAVLVKNSFAFGGINSVLVLRSLTDGL